MGKAPRSRVTRKTPTIAKMSASSIPRKRVTRKRKANIFDIRKPHNSSNTISAAFVF